MESSTLIATIVFILVVALTIAVVFYLLSLKNKHDNE